MNSFKNRGIDNIPIVYVSYKDIKVLMPNLKAVYTAVDETSAPDAFNDGYYEKVDRQATGLGQAPYSAGDFFL